jgi:hypothetical protein
MANRNNTLEDTIPCDIQPTLAEAKVVREILECIVNDEQLLKLFTSYQGYVCRIRVHSFYVKLCAATEAGGKLTVEVEAGE